MSLIVFVVRDTGVLLISSIEFPVIVAVAETGTVKTSSLTAIVVSLVGEVCFFGITIRSAPPAAI